MGIALAIAFALAFAGVPTAQARGLSTIHQFTGADGAVPISGVVMDRGGNLYGTTTQGGGSGFGEVFKLTRTQRGWVLMPLYSFASGSNGSQPYAGVVFGPDGDLYGTTYTGGSSQCNNGYGCGTIFKLAPPPTTCTNTLCPWTETVLYRFTAGNDGQFPTSGVSFDRAGNIYGTTSAGGGPGCGGGGCGTVYQLTHSGGGWAETVLYRFTGGIDGEVPTSGVILDQAGNLYGVTDFGGSGKYHNGVAYELMPSGSGWTETVLHSFDGFDGGPESPTGNLIFDGSGNLYGTTPDGGSGGGGTVFMLSQSQGSWTETTIWNFSGVYGDGPRSGVTMDPAGNLYGTTFNDGGAGSIFKLTPTGSGGWSETDLYDFTDFLDGGHPAGVILDATGHIYGTTNDCGQYCQGTVWEFTQ